MTGMTSPADSPAGQAAAAARELYKQDDYVQALQDLSHDELRDRMSETVALEKVAIQEWLDSGDCYVISHAGKLHLPTCDSMQRFMDRDSAWFTNLRFPQRLQGDAPDDDPIPAWPILRTRTQIEALSSYTPCPLCAPMPVPPEARFGAKQWTHLHARNLKSKHFGTEFRSADGSILGALTKITTVETIDGLDFTAEFEHAEAPITDPDIELMYRTGMRALANQALS
ncbi:hypothetical protein QE394_001040 [Arthrobacter sp. SORGH_AS 212]|uniref:hypothetical protein n=1 Tax=Pseudarthrobacter sp. SORGH_AS 212 TaxID=3041777 RepID=UPI0027821105|nr:hypothetical protein [Arthrobacter sp. SORGH_AS_0212]